MRAIALLLALLVGCTSTATVPGGSAASIKDGVLVDHEGDEVRIDPNSDVRFQRTDGSWTPWRSASDLWVNDEGVLVPYHASVADLDRMHVEGLDDGDRARLEGAGGESNPTGLELHGELRTVLTGFVADRTSAPSGTYSFRTRDGVWFDGVPGDQLPGVLRDGLTAHDGLRFADMRSAEVKNLNGGKTLVAVVAVSAVAVGLVAVVVLSKGKVAPDFPLKAVAAASKPLAHGALRVAVHMPRYCCYYGGGGGHKPKSASPEPAALEPEETSGLSKPGYALPSGASYRLFDGVDRRRAALRFGAALDFGGPLSARDTWTASAVPMVRITDLFEIGGGLRMLGLGDRVDRVWLARVGLHAELDARRRFALPFLLDVGGSSTVGFHARLGFGLRVRLVDAWSLGIYPLNPTYTRLSKTVEPVPHWSFPSTIETSFTF